MSRTDKDVPYWVRVMHAPDSERHIYHRPGCENSPVEARARLIGTDETVVGTERVRKTFMKMVDGNHIFFGAEVLSAPLPYFRRANYTPPPGTVYTYGGMRYFLDYDKDAHPDARPVEIDSPYAEGHVRFVTYVKWVDVPVIEKTFTYSETETHPCELAPAGKVSHGNRQSTCAAYLSEPHRCNSTKEMRREGYTAPERAHVRDVLRAAVHDYNTHGETEIEPVNRQPRRAPWGGGYWD